jgi:hypothetical protein
MKLKYFIILIAMIISTAGLAQEEQNLKAFYIGFDKEYKTYSFEDADGVNTEFSKVKSDVLKKFDLLSPRIIDQAFMITYTVKEIEEDGDYIEEYTIIFLKPIELERNEESEEDYDDEE